MYFGNLVDDSIFQNSQKEMKKVFFCYFKHFKNNKKPLLKNSIYLHHKCLLHWSTQSRGTSVTVTANGAHTTSLRGLSFFASNNLVQALPLIRYTTRSYKEIIINAYALVLIQTTNEQQQHTPHQTANLGHYIKTDLIKSTIHSLDFI